MRLGTEVHVAVVPSSHVVSKRSFTAFLGTVQV